MLAKSLSDHDYTCGSHLFSPAEKRKIALSMVLRPNLQCAMPIEICYYGADIGRKDLCSHCASPEAVVCPELKNKFETVLLMCDECRKKGEKPFTARAFGQVKNKFKKK